MQWIRPLHPWSFIKLYDGPVPLCRAVPQTKGEYQVVFFLVGVQCLLREDFSCLDRVWFSNPRLIEIKNVNIHNSEIYSYLKETILVVNKCKLII